MTPARRIAFDILAAVERGGYASDMLAASTLDSRDAALASEIVFGVLRFEAQLDFLIAHYSARPKLDTAVKLALRMAIYQLRYLDRVPAHAAVNDSVELIKRARKVSAAGFANAVLRRVNRDPIVWPSRAVELSHPEWILARWDRTYGVDVAAAIARANLARPEIYIRVPSGAKPPLEAEATDIPGCFRVPPWGGRSVSVVCHVMDIGSQSIVPLLDLAPGQTFLDLCAAPGNKTAQALESGVRAVACDLHPRRAAMLKGLSANIVVLDGTQPLPFNRRFDRILVDAPCSGTGTLARNPEIKWKLRPEDIADLHGRQAALLRRALECLAPGGRLVYSTCSLEPEENEEVVAEFSPSEIMHRIPGRDPGDGFFAAVIKS